MNQTILIFSLAIAIVNKKKKEKNQEDEVLFDDISNDKKINEYNETKEDYNKIFDNIKSLYSKNNNIFSNKITSLSKNPIMLLDFCLCDKNSLFIVKLREILVEYSFLPEINNENLIAFKKHLIKRILQKIKVSNVQIFNTILSIITFLLKVDEKEKNNALENLSSSNIIITQHGLKYKQEIIEALNESILNLCNSSSDFKIDSNADVNENITIRITTLSIIFRTSIENLIQESNIIYSNIKKIENNNKKIFIKKKSSKYLDDNNIDSSNNIYILWIIQLIANSIDKTVTYSNVYQIYKFIIDDITNFL